LRVIARMNVGGPARIVADLMEDLDPARFEQRLLTGRVGVGEADELELRPRSFTVTRVDGLGRAPNVLADPQALARVMSQIREFRPHIVETHTAKAGVIGRIAAFAARAPATVHVYHGHLLHGYFSSSMTKGVVGIERLLARHTTRLVAVGHQVRDELVAARIGRADQYDVLVPGVEPTFGVDRSLARRELGLSGDSVVVAFVGRLAGVKRPDRLGRVAELVARTCPEVEFVIAGDGTGLGDLQVAALSPSLRGRMHFLGWRVDVANVYAASDIVLLTSDNEGMPLSLIEAAAAGRPTVTTDVGSAAEVVVDGVTGIVCPIDDAALADAVIALATDKPRREAMGAAAIERARTEFSRARVAERMAALYDRVVS
jgi:glycosyltransferase involved in cell wall biosynthesis